ncbi:hypothetical protein [Bacillus sonorensis]|uniref:hypothetical protein n=1 Tax=Bacillus sonorensis TaxID=119858 RepID=UPI0018CEB923|nr:hypothetical protein [Bacillus sonorensis]MCY8025264.1 hypothetical protein [Bacillus sonorensis]MCY8405718.1 hypothetical protein [Bacillus sonorensis]
MSISLSIIKARKTFQLTAVHKREQIKASVHSENFDGEIMSGAKTDGFVLFPVQKLSKPEDINSVRVKWDFWPDKNTSEGLNELDAQFSF